LLHAGGAVLAADGDVNYSFWMTLPLTLSAGCVAATLRPQSVRRYCAGWFGAGAFLSLSVLIRPSAVSLVLLFAAAAAFEAHRGHGGALPFFRLLLPAGRRCRRLCVAAIHAARRFDAVLAGYANVRRYAADSVASIVVGAAADGAPHSSVSSAYRSSFPLVTFCWRCPLFHWTLREATRQAAAGMGMLDIWFRSACRNQHDLALLLPRQAPLWAAYTVLVLRPSCIVGRFVASWQIEGCGRQRFPWV